MFASKPAYLLLSPIALCGAIGCTIPGAGDGYVLGSLAVENCRDGDPLTHDGDYDLQADFFAGDPLLDFSESTADRRSSVNIRIQETSNQIEQSDGLMVRMHDIQGAAAAFSRGEPLSADECFDLAGCRSGGLLLRVQLNLYNTCPSNKSALIASNAAMTLQDGPEDPAGRCLLPDASAAAPAAGCPEISEADRQTLDELCAASFTDRANATQIQQILGSGSVLDDQQQGGPSCMYLCELGGARRGMSAEEAEDFQLDYGDRIAALFAFNLVDSRSMEIGTCSRARGQVHGMFSFEMVRSRTAQAFP